MRAMLKVCGLIAPAYWCAAFVVYVCCLLYGVAACPLPRSASCDDLLARCRARLALVPKPVVGGLFFVMAAGSETDAVHVGFVETTNDDGSFGTLEGNASNPERPASRNGDGVYRRRRGAKGDATRYKFADLAKL
jgi:hypothetical protein